jgi:hypothetical protein
MNFVDKVQKKLMVSHLRKKTLGTNYAKVKWTTQNIPAEFFIPVRDGNMNNTSIERLQDEMILNRN